MGFKIRILDTTKFNPEYITYELPIINKENTLYIPFQTFLVLICKFKKCNMARELCGISKNNYFKEKKGRIVDTYINGQGLLEFLNKSLRLNQNEKEDILTELKINNMVDKNIILMTTRKEKLFASDLIDFMRIWHKKVQCQKLIGNYVVDFLIDNFVIEYDENNHKSYDKKQEDLRQKNIENQGYKIIRISDEKSNAYNLGLIAKEVL